MLPTGLAMPPDPEVHVVSDFRPDHHALAPPLQRLTMPQDAPEIQIKVILRVAVRGSSQGLLLSLLASPVRK